MPAQHSITEPAPGRSGFDTGQTLRRQKAPMTAINEFRVRPVTRFNLTHFMADGPSQSCGSVGEFGSLNEADTVARALQASIPGATYMPLKEDFVIVAIHTHQVETKAYFADSRKGAEKVKADAEATHGTEFAIFSR